MKRNMATNDNLNTLPSEWPRYNRSDPYLCSRSFLKPPSWLFFASPESVFNQPRPATTTAPPRSLPAVLDMLFEEHDHLVSSQQRLALSSIPNYLNLSNSNTNQQLHECNDSHSMESNNNRSTPSVSFLNSNHFPMTRSDLPFSAYLRREFAPYQMNVDTNQDSLPPMDENDNSNHSSPCSLASTIDNSSDTSDSSDDSPVLSPGFVDSPDEHHVISEPICCQGCPRKFSRTDMFYKHMLKHVGIDQPTPTTTTTTITTPPTTTTTTPATITPTTTTSPTKRSPPRATRKRQRVPLEPGHYFYCEHVGCDKRFKRPEHLKRHTNSHSLIKPFRCECGKEFSRKDNFNMHKATHERQRERQLEHLKAQAHRAQFEAQVEEDQRRQQAEVNNNPTTRHIDRFYHELPDTIKAFMAEFPSS